MTVTTVKTPGWRRALSLAIGLIVVVLGIMVLLFPQIIAGLLTVISAIVFLLVGGQLIANSVSGQTIVITDSARTATREQDYTHKAVDTAAT